MDKLTAIKIKYDDGTYSDEIPISALAENVEWNSSYSLVDILGEVAYDTKGSIQDQISQLFNEKVNFFDLQSYINNTMPSYITSWLKENVDPVGSAIIVDDSLSISGAAADAKITGEIKDGFIKTNSYNFINIKNLNNRTTSGITWSIDYDNERILVNGTSTALTVFMLLDSPLKIPEGIKVGKTYKIKYNSSDSNILFQFVCYKNNSTASPQTTSFTENSNFTIPSDCTGMALRLRIAKNITINSAIISEFNFLSAETNEDLENEVNNIKDKLTELTINTKPLVDKIALPAPLSSVIKELYIPNLSFEDNITKIQIFKGRIGGSGNNVYYFSEIRMTLNNDSNSFLRVAYTVSYDIYAIDYNITKPGHIDYLTLNDNINVFNNFNDKINYFSCPIYKNGSSTKDKLDVYILFNTLNVVDGTSYNITLSKDKITSLSYNPSITAFLLQKQSLNKKRILTNFNEDAISTENSYQAPDQFLTDDLIKVFNEGILLPTSEYELYKQGKVIFNSSQYNLSNLLIEYTKSFIKIPDFINTLSNNRNGFRLYEANVTNSYDFVPDPLDNSTNVLRLKITNTIPDSCYLVRSQFDRYNLNYTEFTEDIDIYIPSGLLAALVSYPEYVHWFALSGVWSPFGAETTATANLYSGCSNLFQLYKTNANDNTIKYQIINRKRKVINNQEVYEPLSSQISDFSVLGDEWIHIKKQIKVGNPGFYKITITDSLGEHVLQPVDYSTQTKTIAYVGVPDPENEKNIYGNKVINNIPYRTLTSTHPMQIYTSKDIINYIITENGNCSLYFKNYKCTNGKNINTYQ